MYTLQTSPLDEELVIKVAQSDYEVIPSVLRGERDLGDIFPRL